MDVISHPGKLLEDHLNGVWEKAKWKLERISEYVNWKEVFGYEKDEIFKVLKIAALHHDAAKSTRYFQDMIRGKSKKSPLSRHSELSALLVAKKLMDEGLSDFLIYCGYAVVRYHHSHLQTWNSESFDDELLQRQKESIVLDDKPWIGELRNLDIEKTIDDVESLEFDLSFEKHGIERYFLLKLLYSVLVSSDWEDAADINPNPPKINLEVLENYTSSLKSNDEISQLRKEFHNQVLKFSSKDPGIFSIAAPTGIGKTLANSALALKISPERNFFYILPMINIIEQTAEVLRKALGDDKVLEYHHLSDLNLEKLDKEHILKQETFQNIKKEDVIARTWNYPVVVSTFVSFLEELIGGSKAPFLYRLPGSALILDEIQAIPHENWKVVKSVVEFLPKLGVVVILSTATMPVIFKGKKIIDASKYYEKLNRVNLIFKGKMDFEEFKENIVKEFKDGKRTLIIANTIKQAEEIFDSFQDLENTCFLSSRVIPKHRRERIEKFKKGEYNLCVSTQVVEAGVDISAERVIRDIAPLDSIFQAAGRCNRHFEMEKGEVLVFHTISEKGSFSKKVYGKFLIDTTESLLNENKVYQEKDFKDLVEKYFEEVTRYGEIDDGNYMEKLKTLDFSKLSNFSLIKDRGFNVSFIILENEIAEKLFEDALNLSENLSGIERRIALSIYIRKLAPYTISTRVWNEENLSAFDIAFGKVIIQREFIENWYDPVKGLRLENGSEVIV